LKQCAGIEKKSAEVSRTSAVIINAKYPNS
jgi:hypothetical protein